MTEQITPSAQGAVTSKEGGGGAAVVGPLTIRDLAVLGAVAIIFIASLIPLVTTPVGSLNLWSTANLFYIAIGMVLPLATAALFLIRRFSPATKLRFGSLSVDQFASVVAVFAALFYFAGTVTDFRTTYLVGLIGALLFMLATSFAPWIPVLAADFAGRAEIPAHPVARDAVPAVKRPAAAKPVLTPAPAPVAEGAAVQVPESAPESNAAPAVGAWAGTRPAAGHTAAGQIFTPAKDERPAAGTTGAAAVSGAAAGVVNEKTNSAAVAGNAARVTGDAVTAAAASSSANVAAAAVKPVVDGAAQKTAAAHMNAPANAGAEASTSAKPAETVASAVKEPATTLNPQLVESVQAPVTAESNNSQAPAKESIAATVNPKTAAPAVIAEPFWFAVDRPQNVIDEKTRQFIYKLTPGSWILALEDRGTSFLVQDSHGKTGVLLDLVGIERASDSQ